MPIKLYYTLISPPTRASLFALKMLNIPHELHRVDLLKGGTLDKNFVKINPQHTVPTLDDNGVILWDSHAINAYLVNQYAADDTLYPKEPKKRAIVDQRLHLDSALLFPGIRSVTRGIIRKKFTSLTEDIADMFKEGYHFAEKFLQQNKYAAGETITIADFSFVTSLTTMNCLMPITPDKYSSILTYLTLCKSTLQYYEEINEEGLKEYKLFLKSNNFNEK